MILSASAFLNMMTPEETKIYKLGKVSSDYVSGRPKILFDGETTASSKKYPYLSSYTPVANDRVLLLVIAGSYVILGKIV